ncbi:hypothetical protein GCM10010401_20590 [Rarobacter faecitabidus]|uniref:Quercetin dioxygenase-like cupin family protein n=1 Tax=Rarobacter faecitabidus TaxID=13243 RepID=A0A542ZV78_RARFA|nr:cupin [Rarobacter faecitabidus]TQL64264.1 hypothetical protein FB461_0762 [Rarobacter faecitabidus]
MAQLPRVASLHLDAARKSAMGRSAEVLLHDGPLRQSIIALTAGSRLADHNSPPAATIQVIEGRIQISSEYTLDEVRAGQLTLLTHDRHGVLAMEDSVFLLTTVTSIDVGSHTGAESHRRMGQHRLE